VEHELAREAVGYECEIDDAIVYEVVEAVIA
jgi:hypothetical protein